MQYCIDWCHTLTRLKAIIIKADIVIFIQKTKNDTIFLNVSHIIGSLLVATESLL